VHELLQNVQCFTALVHVDSSVSYELHLFNSNTFTLSYNLAGILLLKVLKNSLFPENKDSWNRKKLLRLCWNMGTYKVLLKDFTETIKCHYVVQS